MGPGTGKAGDPPAQGFKRDNPSPLQAIPTTESQDIEEKMGANARGRNHTKL
jgi:hypothetical protein